MTTPTPKTHAEVAKADGIVIAWRETRPHDNAKADAQLRDAIATALREASTSITVDGVVYGENMIRLLQQQANECRAAGYIDDAGNVRRVLGTLPITADGCVFGDGAMGWTPVAKGDVFCSGRWWNGCTPSRCYSTREAALTAKDAHAGEQGAANGK